MAEVQTQNLTLMFVDIPTIGTIREQRGEAEARDCQQRCLALLGDIRKKYAGNLVRSIGGTLLCSFLDAGDAVDAAVGMQEAIVSSGLADSGVHVRMGLHCGPVHVRAGNYSGEVVTMAARMVTLAKPQCIVATGDVLEQAGERVERRFSPLTGEAAERLNLDLYEVAWREEAPLPGGGEGDTGSFRTDSPVSKRKTASSRLRPRATVSGMQVRKVVALREVRPAGEQDAGAASVSAPAALAVTPPSAATATPPSAATATQPGSAPAGPAPSLAATPAPARPDAAAPAAPSQPRANRLCLIWREKILKVDGQTSVTMGRDPGSDVVLQVNTASRHHAEICCRNGQFLIVDRSANGTFIYDEKGEEYFVHQREARLAESGAICPGCPQEEAGCEALLYWMAD
jgi:hypothetical protein